jgi:peptidoglycan/LPS O-acetylase OafA/YrhL
MWFDPFSFGHLARGIKMKNPNTNWSTSTAICTFLIGVILLWSFGKRWLNFESAPVFVAGLIGVAIPVLIVGVWQIYRGSKRK